MLRDAPRGKGAFLRRFPLGKNIPVFIKFYYFKKVCFIIPGAESSCGKITTEKQLFDCMRYFADENGGGSLVRTERAHPRGIISSTLNFPLKYFY